MASITSLSCGPQQTNQGNTGETLLINGTALQGATTATIGSRTVPAAVNGAGTQVTCTVPGGCGVQNVSVKATSGTSNALPFYYIPTPVLSGVTPTEGSAAAPTAVTINGTDLLTTNRVSFNGVATTAAPTINGDNSITVVPNALTPIGAAPWFQTVSVAVRTAGGTTTLTNALIAYDTPVINTLSPNSGPAGTEVTISGTGFVSGSIEVTFGGIQADFTAISDVTLSATAPAGLTGSVNVVVITPGGASAPVPFTYV